MNGDPAAEILEAIFNTGGNVRTQLFIEAEREVLDSHDEETASIEATAATKAALRVPFLDGSGIRIKKMPIELDAEGKSVAVNFGDGSQLSLSGKQSVALDTAIVESLSMRDLGPTLD